jgi:hypothetical protein
MVLLPFQVNLNFGDVFAHIAAIDDLNKTAANGNHGFDVGIFDLVSMYLLRVHIVAEGIIAQNLCELSFILTSYGLAERDILNRLTNLVLQLFMESPLAILRYILILNWSWNRNLVTIIYFFHFRDHLLKFVTVSICSFGLLLHRFLLDNLGLQRDHLL